VRDDDRDLLLAAEWNLPLTDEFVAAVRRGTRRRRLLRRAAVAGTAAVVAFVALFAVTGRGTTTVVVPPATAPAGPAPLGPFRIGYLPTGVRAATPDGSFTCTAAAGMRECPPARPGTPVVTVSQRRYDKAPGGARLWITVLDPGDFRAATPWLVDWLTIGTSPVSAFDAPAGHARALAARGSEVTVYSIVLTTDDGIVVSITGTAGSSAAELTRVARGISR